MSLFDGVFYDETAKQRLRLKVLEIYFNYINEYFYIFICN